MYIEIVGMVVLSTVMIRVTYLVLMVPKDRKIGNEKYIKIMKQSS